MEIYLRYASVNGGTNNLQIAEVVIPAPYAGLVDILKTFSSTKGLAYKRALAWVKKHS